MGLFERLRGSRWCRGLLGFFATISVLNLVVVDTASADVGSQMLSFVNGLGGSANVTGPTAYQGQAGGYYTGGSVWIRTKDEQLTLGSLQLPSAKAGCGGIDLFTGGFSFINSDQLVAAGKAVANGALMFVFQMALKAISSLIDSTLTDQLQKLQQKIADSKSACQTGMNMAAGLAGEMGARNTQFCSMVGNSQGFFSDWAASEQGCGTGGQQSSTLKRNTDSTIPASSMNYTWNMLTKNFPNWDTAWKQYLMTVVGTIVYTAPADNNSGGGFKFYGNSDEGALTTLLNGGTFQALTCGSDTTDCLTPTLSDYTLSQSQGLESMVQAQIADMYIRISSEQKLTDQEIAILGSTSIPLYKILSVASLSRYGGGLIAGDISNLAELVSVDMLHTFLRKEVSVVQGAGLSFQDADKDTVAQWRANMERVAVHLFEIERSSNAKVQKTESIIQRTMVVEQSLRNSLSPTMSASIALDRSLAQPMN